MVAEVQQLPTAAARTPASFVHLHLHTQYSIVDGLVKVPDLMQAVAAADMPAVALSDAGNLFAMVKFYTRELREGIKPIIGVEISMRDEDQVSGVVFFRGTENQVYERLKPMYCVKGYLT